jgi:hypothetical protein
MLAAWQHVASDKPMPWPMEIYQMCQMFNCLPFPGALFDQPPDMLQAIRVCLSVSRTADKKAKDYDRVDTRIKRIVDILKMAKWEEGAYRRKLRQICGPGIYDEDGRIVLEEFKRLGIEMILGDVIRKLGIRKDEL